MATHVVSSRAVRMLLRVSFFYPGKTLTSPLFVFLTIAIVCLLVALRRQARGRAPIVIALIALASIWLGSTPIVASLVIRSLLVPTDSDVPPPDVIVVASSGYWYRDDPKFDLPSYASFERTVAAVEWWKQHPNARFVIAGRDIGGTPPLRSIELMRDVALQRGVPATRIEYDAWSTNTREHPLGVLRLPGIGPETRIGVVTSSWHMRRTAREFRRHFRNVIAHPAPPERLRTQSLNDVLPDPVALVATTKSLQEWLGMAWYALRR